MNSVAVLEGAIDLIKQGWTQKALARNERGWTVSPMHHGACTWCIEGALFKAQWDLSPGVEGEYLDPMASRLVAFFRAPISEWNDQEGRTQSEVVEAMEEFLNSEENLS